MIDVRMANDSGIGTYIRNVVPRMIAARPAWRFTLLGHLRAMQNLGWGTLVNVRLVDHAAPIYSVLEQLLAWRSIPGDADLFWSPHYNVPLLYRGRLAVTIHDVGHLVLPEYDRFVKRGYARAMLRTVRRRASVVLCDSDYTRREYDRLVGRGRAEPQVVHLGVSDEWRTAEPDPAKAGERPYIIYVGNVKPHKNLATLLKAFHRIHQVVPHDLVLVGRREGMRTVDSSVQQDAASLGSRVRFTGEVPAGELRALVAGADALVMPSIFEGFGLPPLEAMAAGCPTLVARAASLPEVCGDASLYCDPLDATDMGGKLRTLLEDPTLRATLRTRGRAHVARYQWARTATTTLEALEGALRLDAGIA